MKVTFNYRSSKAIVQIQNKKVILPLNYVQYFFGNREMKPVPNIKK